MNSVQIEVISDFICPWCWIGHRYLQRAINDAGMIDIKPVRYLPYELNPSMPVHGLDRKAYRSVKFGSWEHSQALDREVALAGMLAGVEFNFDKISVTPNTRLAHRLMQFVQVNGSTEQVQQLFDAIFCAYFSAGLDIGSMDVLVHLATTAGLHAGATHNYLEGVQGIAEVVVGQLKAHSDGVRSVPYLVIGGKHVNGARGAPHLIKLIELAANNEE